ncbi:MAG: TolC family protein [Fimbriimonadaceae bacterium]
MIYPILLVVLAAQGAVDPERPIDLAPAVPPIQESDVLTLEQAMEIGLRNAFLVRTAEARLRETEASKREAQSALGLRGSVQGRYTFFDREQRAQFGEQTVVIQARSGGSAQIDITLPLDINGNIRRNIRAVGFAVRASEMSLRGDVNEIKSQIRRGYNQILQSEALVKVQEDAVVASLQQLQNARKLFEAQEVAKVDVLRFESQLAFDESNLVQARNRLELAKQNFNNLLVRPIETPIRAVSVQEMPPIPTDVDELVAVAITNRPDVRRQGFLLEQAGQRRRLFQNANAPQLNLGVNYTRNINNSGFSGSDYSASASIVMQWPIIDGGQSRAQVQQVDAQIDQLQIQLEQILLGASLEVRSAVQTMIDARAQMLAFERNVEAAEEAYRLSILRVQAGEGITLEILNAQTALTQARAGVATSRYDYLNAYALLLRALGVDSLEEYAGSLGTEPVTLPAPAKPAKPAAPQPARPSRPRPNTDDPITEISSTP